MKILFLLIVISICVAGFFLIAFFWAIRNDQFEDNYGESRRALFDDTNHPLPTTKTLDPNQD